MEKEAPLDMKALEADIMRVDIPKKFAPLKMSAILSCDITSTVKPKHTYGKKGERVEVISESDDGVVLVRSKSGTFSVRKEKLI